MILREKNNKYMENSALNTAKWYRLMGVDYYIENQNKQVQKEESFAIQASNEPENEAPDNQAPDKVSIARKIADKVTSLDELEQELLKFDLCDLKFGAKNLVFSDGTKNAKIMLIGEAPGATEDEQGIPFCGVSGQLLDNMLTSIGLSRQKNFYITNTVFWRPPDNRQPTAEEVAICRPFVEKHIALIAPEIIVLVGGVAVSSILGSDAQISKARGNIYKYSNPYINSVDTTAIFHPAYLIRQPFKKKTAWFDLLKLRNILREKGVF